MSLFGTLTAIGGAIASTASAIGAPVAALAGMVPGVSAGAAATAGSVAGSAALGSASGAALSAATGGDPGQGALFGALGGGLTAGAGAGLEALSSTATQAGGITGAAGQAATAAQPSVSAITQGVASPGFQQAAGGIQGAAQVAAAEPSVSAITQGVATPAFQQASQAAANAAGSGGIGSLVNNDFVKSTGVDLAKEGIGSGIQNMQQQEASKENRALAQQSKMNFENQSAQQEEDAKNKVNQTFQGLNFAKGGEVGLQEGQFIIPADVVSALGNGSTKAGANFLDEFFKV